MTVAARVAETLVPDISKTPGVAGAYLFGSVLGSMRADSDIDLALVPMPGSDPFQTVGELESRLRTVEGHPVHVTVLSRRNVRFAMEVLRTGKLIFTGDVNALTDFMEHVSRLYPDEEYMHRRAMEDIYG